MAHGVYLMQCGSWGASYVLLISLFECGFWIVTSVAQCGSLDCYKGGLWIVTSMAHPVWLPQCHMDCILWSVSHEHVWLMDVSYEHECLTSSCMYCFS